MKYCEFNINGFKMQTNLNILSLGSDDMFIEMDWLERHILDLICYDKKISCLDEESNTIVVKRIPKIITSREFLLYK